MSQNILTLTVKNVSHLSASQKPNVSHNIIRLKNIGVDTNLLSKMVWQKYFIKNGNNLHENICNYAINILGIL
jgi:hypothetical protein